MVFPCLLISGLIPFALIIYQKAYNFFQTIKNTG